jgi:plastocyanin
VKKLVLVVALAFGLAAGGVALAAAPTTLRITTDAMAMKFSKKTLTAHPGKVTIVMTNAGVLPHNVAIKGKGVNVKGKIVAKGGVSRVTAVLKRGTYRYYCSVPGHEAGGMWGTLVVK